MSSKEVSQLSTDQKRQELYDDYIKDCKNALKIIHKKKYKDDHGEEGSDAKDSINKMVRSIKDIIYDPKQEVKLDSENDDSKIFTYSLKPQWIKEIKNFQSKKTEYIVAWSKSEIKVTSTVHRQDYKNINMNGNNLNQWSVIPNPEGQGFFVITENSLLVYKIDENTHKPNQKKKINFKMNKLVQETPETMSEDKSKPDTEDNPKLEGKFTCSYLKTKYQLSDQPQFTCNNPDYIVIISRQTSMLHRYQINITNLQEVVDQDEIKVDTNPPTVDVTHTIAKVVVENEKECAYFSKKGQFLSISQEQLTQDPYSEKNHHDEDQINNIEQPVFLKLFTPDFTDIIKETEERCQETTECSGHISLNIEKIKWISVTGLLTIGEDTQTKKTGLYSITIDNVTSIPVVSHLIDIDINDNDISDYMCSSGFRFIMLAAKNYEFKIWSRMRNGEYGLISETSISMEELSILITENLSKIYLYSYNKLVGLDFSPFDTMEFEYRKLSYQEDTCKENNSRIIIWLDSRYCVSIESKGLYIIDSAPNKPRKHEEYLKCSLTDFKVYPNKYQVIKIGQIDNNGLLLTYYDYSGQIQPKPKANNLDSQNSESPKTWNSAFRIFHIKRNTNSQNTDGAIVPFDVIDLLNGWQNGEYLAQVSSADKSVYFGNMSKFYKLNDVLTAMATGDKEDTTSLLDDEDPSQRSPLKIRAEQMLLSFTSVKDKIFSSEMEEYINRQEDNITNKDVSEMNYYKAFLHNLRIEPLNNDTCLIWQNKLIDTQHSSKKYDKIKFGAIFYCENSEPVGNDSKSEPKISKPYIESEDYFLSQLIEDDKNSKLSKRYTNYAYHNHITQAYIVPFATLNIFYQEEMINILQEQLQKKEANKDKEASKLRIDINERRKRLDEYKKLNKDYIEVDNKNPEETLKNIVKKSQRINIYAGYEHMKCSKNQKYILLYGKSGYTLMVKRSKSSSHESNKPKCESNGSYTSTMSNEISNEECEGSKPESEKGYELVESKCLGAYSIDLDDYACFCPDEKHLVIAFPKCNKTVLYELNGNKEPRRTILSHSNQVCRNYTTYNGCTPIFAFPNKRLLVVSHRSNDKANLVIVYDLKEKRVVRTCHFSKRIIPTYFGLEPSKTDLSKENETTGNLVVIFITLAKNSLSMNRGAYYCLVPMESTNTLPFRFCLPKEIYNYFMDDSASVKENSVIKLKNIYSSMLDYQFASNFRIVVSLYMLDHPNLLHDIVKQGIDLNIFLSSHSILDIVFMSKKSFKIHSAKDFSKLFNEMVSDKKYPLIKEHDVVNLIKFKEDIFSFNDDTRQILTNLLFFDSHARINGLVEERYKSLKELESQEVYNYHLDSNYLIQRAKDTLVLKPAETNDYSIYTTRIKLDLSLGSEMSVSLMKLAIDMPDEEVKYKYKQIVNYRYDKLASRYILLYTLCYLFLNFLGYLYFGYEYKSWLFAPIVAISGVFLLIEFISLKSLWDFQVKENKHSTTKPSSILSFLDIYYSWSFALVHTVCIAACIIIQTSVSRNIKDLTKLLALSLLSLQGLVLLKILGPLRYIIILTGRIMWQLRWFPFLISGVVMLAATMLKIAPLPGDRTKEEYTFLEALQEVVLIMFMGAKADSSEIAEKTTTGGIIRSIILVAGGTLLSQGILSIVIATFMQYFNLMKNDIELYNVKDKMLQLLHADIFFYKSRLFSTNLLGYLKKPVNSHYMILVPVPKDGNVVEVESQKEKRYRQIEELMSIGSKKMLDGVVDKAKGALPNKAEVIEAFKVALDKHTLAPSEQTRKFSVVVNKIVNGEKLSEIDYTNASRFMSEYLSESKRKSVNKLSDWIDKYVENGKLSMDDCKEILSWIESSTETNETGNEMSAVKSQINEKVKELKDILKKFDELTAGNKQ